MIKIDLTNKVLTESWLKMWGFWNKKLVKHIYGDDVNVVANLNEENTESLQFSIKGEYEDVKAYATALKAEADYLRAYIDNGKDAPETKKAKEGADAASKTFVEKTGLPWPFKD
jgi:hypothetical protein